MHNHHRSAIYIPARHAPLTGCCFGQRASQVTVFVGFLVATLAGVEGDAQSREKVLSFVIDGNGSATIVIPVTPDFWTTEGSEWLAEYVHRARVPYGQTFSDDDDRTWSEPAAMKDAHSV